MSSIKLILGGRTLQDAQTLSACGLSASSRVLVIRGASGGQGADADAEKQAALERLRRVAEGLAGGNDRDDRYSLQLENQVRVL